MPLRIALPTLMFAATVAANTLDAQTAFTPGTYITPDGRYSITVTSTSEGLEVREPNRTTLYRRRSEPNRYYAMVNGTEYGLEVVSSTTIASFTARGRTSLALKEALVIPATATASDLEFTVPEHALLTAFDAYKQKVVSDPANVHVHAACGAAALAKATFNRFGYREYTRGVVAGLKQLLQNPNGPNPCPDVIEGALWQ